MKVFLYAVFIIVVLTVSTGFYLQSSNDELAHQLIGGGIAGLFFIWMPSFIYHRWKNRSIKDYMLTQDNIERMNQFRKNT